MNKPRLIDYDNTNATRSILDLSFEIKSDNIDLDIIDYLDNQIFGKELDVIIIKDSLSKNYLEFYGLLLAHHIRLSDNKKEKYLPIVIISDLNIYQLSKLTPLAKICYTEGVYLVNNELKKIDDILKKDLKGLDDNSFNDSFLNLITIEPPSNYDSRHSIANEWSIYKWADFLKITIDEVEKNISSMLYFKYLKALNIREEPLKRKIQIQPKKPRENGKILFIDDEWKKGWGVIFKKYFENNKNFSVLEEDYKDKNQEEIIKIIIETINKDELPDIVILDLRLNDIDFTFNDEKDLKKITGMQLIEKIHKINKGIQIILWTASGDSNILNHANSLNILGYIKKGYPGDRTANVNDTIKQFAYLINEGLEKSYLKEIYATEESILKLEISEKIEVEVKSVFEILNTDMDNRFIYAMFAIYKILEIIKDKYIDNKSKFKKNNKPIKLIKKDVHGVFIPKSEIESKEEYNSTANRVKSILFEILDIKDKSTLNQIEYISNQRNCAIHSKKPICKTLSTVDSKNILEWFQIIETILEKEISI